MRISPIVFNSKPNNFAGVYYTLVGLFPSEVRSDLPNKDSFESFKDSNPPKLLQEIAEDTTFFKDLSSGTDVFVTAAFDEDKKSALKTGYFHAIFKDPYDNKESIDEINLQSVGFSEDVILEKLKRFVNNLPMYNNLKKNNEDNRIVILNDKKNAVVGNIFFDLD